MTLERIEKLMVELETKDEQIRIHEEMLQKISDNLTVAVWGKDIDNHFVYANKVCCDTILKCTEEEAIAKTDSDFEQDLLSSVCLEGDELVKESMKPMRFLEHARYPGMEDVWIDSTKSPWFDKGILIGTVGIAKIITEKISQENRDRLCKSGLIEIPLDGDINEILDRRSLK